MLAALALAGALAIFIFGAYQPAAAQQAPSASRSFSAMTVAPGDTVTVSIATANTGGIGRVTERLPSGFAYARSSLPAGNVNTTNASAPVFNLFGAGDSFTYDVTAPMTTGEYTFSGTLRSGDPPTDHAVGGDTTVRVRAASQAPTGAISVNGTPKPAAGFSPISAVGTSDVTLMVTFSVSNRVDGSPSNTDGAGNYVSSGDAIEVMVPAALVPTLPTDLSKYTAMQNGREVGRIHIDGRNIVINEPGGTGHGIVQSDDLITLTAEGLTLASTVATNQDIRISQTGSGRTVRLGVYDPEEAPTSIKAYIDSNDANTLKIEFKTQTNTTRITIDPAVDYLLSNSNVKVDQTTSASDHAPMPEGTDLDALLIDPDDGHTNTKFTITVSKLTDLAVGDKIRISQLEAGGSGYSATVVVGGPTVSPGTTGVDSLTGVLSSSKADTAVSVKLGGAAADDAGNLTAGTPIAGGRDIVVKMPGFQVPDSIDEDTVIIDGMGTSEFYGNPASVSVSGSNITLSLPTRNVATGALIASISGGYQVVFKQSAGIKTPNSAGMKTITVQDRDSDNHELKVEIVDHISAKPGWVERGDTVTVTAKGINATGDATVHLLNMGNFEDVAVLERHDNTSTIDDIAELETTVKTMLANGRLDGEGLAVLPALDRSLMDGGTAVMDFDTSSAIFHAGAQDATAAADAKGTNILIVVDAGGNVIDHTRLGLQPTVTLDVTEVRRTGRMKVTVSDWYYGDLSDLRVNGIQVRLPDRDNADASVVWSEQSPPTSAPLTVVVPRRARLGVMEVVVSGTTTEKQGSLSSLDKHTQTVNVGVFDLEITPSTAVTDQVIRIEGSGFGPTQCIVSITVGDEHIRRATTGDQVRIGSVADCVRTDSDGTLSNSFKVPHNLKPNTYPVVITDALNRVGQGEIAIPKPAITLDPDASQRGSTVTVIGENFPAEDVVGITYGADPVTVATTDTVGKWRATFKVPVDATIGREYEVVAQSEKKGTGQPRVVTGENTVSLNAKATHTVPEEILTVSPEEVSSGQRLTIKAENLPLFTPVGLTIGGLGVAGRAIGEDDASDGFGRYEKVLLVPQLTVGTHNVELRVHTVGSDVVVVTFVDILDIVTRPTNEVFADLIANDQLASVWRYRIDETGSDWDSFDPQYIGQPGINDLETVSTRDIVWIRVTENVTFQGAPLFTGWNLRTLE